MGLAMSADGKYVVTGADHAILWEVGTGKKLRSFRQKGQVAISNNGQQLVIAFWNEATLWDTATGKANLVI